MTTPYNYENDNNDDDDDDNPFVDNGIDDVVNNNVNNNMYSFGGIEEQDYNTTDYYPHRSDDDGDGDGGRGAKKSSPSTKYTRCENAIRRFFCNDLLGTFRCTPSFRSGDCDNERQIDIVRSFSPQHVLAKIWKIVPLTLEIYAITSNLVENPRVFWLAYATQWALVLSTAYSLLSLLNSIWVVSQPINETVRVGFRVQLTWILYILAANSELIVTILYWALLYDGGMPSAYSILVHGTICLTVWIDGVLVNRIPVRARHWLEISIWYSIAYLVWSIIASPLVTGIGNQDKQDNDPETNDDLIYPVLNWKDEPIETTVLAVIIIFGVSPVIHLIMVACSRCTRKYVDDSNNDSNNENVMNGSGRQSDDVVNDDINTYNIETGNFDKSYY